MLELAGYSVTEVISLEQPIVVCRCIRERDRLPVIAKFARAEHALLEMNAALKHEFELTQRMEPAHVLTALALEATPNGHALISEDFGGLPLESWLEQNNASLETSLELAVRLANIVASLHKSGLIHKDVHPGNFFVSADLSIVKITGFGIAAIIPKERSQLSVADTLEGTLAYMSPEQTGRMNRSIDQRADLYSLGVTLYRLFTGRLPFVAKDPLQLVYSHIAELPTSPQKINGEIPSAISQIVMKLLSKTTEDRYQSALGLKADLESCLEKLHTTGRIDDFPLGTRDSTERLAIPQKLYGRERERQDLLNAFDRVAKGNLEFVLISGYSGIGKSALVGEVIRPIEAKRGFFITGKFDQFRRDIPYSGMKQAFRSLVQKLLVQSSEQIQGWRARLLAALGGNGQDIIDLIPELEFVIGPQPKIMDQGTDQARARFLETFRRFVRVFAQSQHPLVLFIDDLQWADASTLKLLRALSRDSELTHFLCIGAYRDNEVEAGHPLTLLLGELRSEGTAITPLGVQPLGLEDITHFLADTLRVERAVTSDLGRLILSKTLGNPFFVIEFLTTLHREGLVRFAAERGAFTWDLELIRRVQITDNVVDLMASRIAELDPRTQRLLELAACMGTKFTLKYLALVDEQSTAGTADALFDALRADMIVPLDPGYKYSERLQNEGMVRPGHLPAIEYRFRHDRIQQAAYQRISREELPRLHLRIGRLILRESAPDEAEDRLFEIVNHLNAGLEILLDGDERRSLAALNLRAARKSKASSAYGPALSFLQTGISLLSPNSWTTDYELTLGLHVERAQSAYLAGAHEEMMRTVEIGLAHVQNALDEVTLLEVCVLHYQHGAQYAKAIETALRALDRLGVSLPAVPSNDDVGAALGATMRALEGQKIEDLANLPEMTDPYRLAEMRILANSLSSAYIVSLSLFPLLVFRLVQCTVQNGLTGLSAYGFATYGLLLLTILGDFDTAYRLARLSFQIIDRFHAEDLRAKVQHVFTLWIRHYKEPFSTCAAQALDGSESGLATGDVEFAGHGMHSHLIFSLVCDDTLASVASKVDRLIAFAQRQNHVHTYSVLGYIRRTVGRLRGLDSAFLSTTNADGEQGLAEGLAYDHCDRTMEYFLLGDPARCLRSAAIVDEHFSAVAGMAHDTLFTFYQSLAFLALYESASDTEKERMREKVETNLKRMQQWATHAPINYAHRYHLVQAESFRVFGRQSEAMQAYERAIVFGRESGFVGELALIYELTARFYLAMGIESVADTYLRDAYRGYRRWGALAVAGRLERSFPRLQSTLVVSAPANTQGPKGFTSTQLDIETMLRATHAISMEIVLPDLLRKLLLLSLENAGGTRAILFLAENNTLIIHAEALAETQEVNVTNTQAIDSCTHLPTSIVHYTARTGHDVVLDNATEDARFLTDSYVQEKGPRSVLCAPITLQGKLVGILYLENHLVAGAFTQQRAEMVRIMAGQAAIAIENARLYQDLDNRVQARTKELRERNEELSRTLSRLREAQQQLIAQEKLASLGALTSGIAHEIRNPLNFVVNFAKISTQLTDELREILEQQRARLDEENREYVGELLRDLKENATTINEQGQRADSIVKAMLEHSRTGNANGDRRLVDINDLLNEYLRIARPHVQEGEGVPAANVEKQFDSSLRPIEIVPQDVGRVFVNILNNAWYAVHDRARASKSGYQPTITISTKELGEEIEIRVRDNGAGIPAAVRDKIFEPFFTTKAPGDGTGLGLSLSHEIIVRGHGGKLQFTTEDGQFTEFLIQLPRTNH